MHTAFACILQCIHRQQIIHVHLHPETVCVYFVDDLYLHNIMLGCAHEQKAYGGGVDRCGQQNAVFVTLVGPIKRFKAQ